MPRPAAFPLPLPLLSLQAFARNLRYRYAPVDELDQSPDAQVCS